MMWKLPLYILYATSFLFALVSADLETSHSPLNSCILTVQSTVGKVADPRTMITWGILFRFSISNPSANRLTIADGGNSGVFEELGDGRYAVGFSVKSDKYDTQELRNMVTEQWNDTHLFERDVGSAGNWKVLSTSC